MKKILYLVFLLTSLIWTTTGLLAQVPVAYYPFSGNAKDASAYANHATVNGALLAQDRFGWSNSAMDFDGVQSYVRAANAAQLNSPVATVGFWVNVTELPATGEVFLISLGGWQERYKVTLPSVENWFGQPTTQMASPTWIQAMRTFCNPAFGHMSCSSMTEQKTRST